MSILIPGLEMPTGCAECPFEMYYFNTGETRCRATNKTLETSYCPTSYEKRDLDCPLVPVPEHGRLIDADALMAEDRQIYRSDGAAIGRRRYIELYEIDDAPTIIPAEEGKT